MTGIRIAGTGRYVPPLTVDNNAFAAFLDTSDEWIRSRTGIVTRHISDGEPSWYMGLQAARQALEAAGISGQQLGLIIDTTVTPDYVTPATACVIQRELGAVNAMAFDVNSACTGFVCGVDMAARYLATDPELSYVLVVSNENLSRITDFSDRSSCILFGDGAGACVLEKKQGLYSAYMMADGTGVTSLYAGDWYSFVSQTDGSACSPRGSMQCRRRRIPRGIFCGRRAEPCIALPRKPCPGRYSRCWTRQA